jgi:hypothetical protein
MTMAEPSESNKVPELALQDTVRYQEQLLRLIIHNDDRAFRLISFSVALMGVLLSAYALTKPLGFYVPLFMGTVALCSFAGCLFAHAALAPADIYLPGNRPDFWQWALNHRQDVAAVTKAYLEGAAQTIVKNQSITERAAKLLWRSSLCIILSPAIGIAVTLIAYLAITFCARPA